MAEAKDSKLREYFTSTTYQFHTKPTDESGQRVFVGGARCPSALAKEAVIRLNDTYRSNWSLAHPMKADDQRQSESPAKYQTVSETASECALNRNSIQVPLTNTVVDQQEL